MKKALFAFASTLLLAGALHAQTPTQLARAEQRLSHEILNAYLTGAHPQQHLLELQRIQRQLKASVSDPEISNLLSFLDLCIQELQGTIHRPLTPGNIEIVSDLTTSIDEGSRFILSSAQESRHLAAR